MVREALYNVDQVAHIEFENEHPIGKCLHWHNILGRGFFVDGQYFFIGAIQTRVY
jgi:hypothetical protein